MHFLVGPIDVPGEIGHKILIKGRACLQEPVDLFLVQNIAKGVLDDFHRGSLPVLADHGQEAEVIPLALDFHQHLLPVFGFHENLDSPFFNNPQAVAGRTVLFQDHGALGIKFQRQLAGCFFEQICL